MILSALIGRRLASSSSISVHSPVVSLLVEIHGLQSKELQGISPSGHHGRLIKGDVLNYLRSGRKTVAAPNIATLPASVSVSSASRAAATNPSVASMPITVPFSEYVPKGYLTAQCGIQELETYCGEMSKLTSPTIKKRDVLVQSAMKVLRDVPSLNLVRGASDEILQSNSADVAVRTADNRVVCRGNRGIRDIALTVTDGKRDDRIVALEVLETDSVHVDKILTIVDAAASATLAVGDAIEQGYVKNGKFSTRLVVQVSLSYDVRVYTEEEAADLLSRTVKYFSDPMVQLM